MVARQVKKKPQPEPAVPWPFPEWKNGEMVVKKLKMPTRKEQIEELFATSPPAVI